MKLHYTEAANQRNAEFHFTKKEKGSSKQLYLNCCFSAQSGQENLCLDLFLTEEQYPVGKTQFYRNITILRSDVLREKTQKAPLCCVIFPPVSVLQ